MKRVVLSVVLSVMTMLATAQYQQVSITDLQFVSQQDLANCNDTSQYFGDTVIIVGKAIHDGGLTELASGSVTGGYRPGLWVVDTANNSAMAPFAAVQLHGVYNGNPVNELDNILAGWTIKVIGSVSRYDGETQFNPINNNIGSTANGDAIEIISTSGAAPAPAVVNMGDLNDQNRENQLETGEQWEGAYIEMHNLTVTAVNFFSSGSRVSFDVADANGNVMNVSDRFIAQKLPSHAAVNAASPQTTGLFTVPPVGAQFDTLRGIVIHSQNGCTGDNGRGYELNPFDSNDYVYGATPPIISNEIRSPKFPTSTDDVDVTVTVTDFDGSVATVELFYDINGSGNYSTVSMSLVSGSTDEFTGQIPAQTDGTIIRYYVEATDNDGNMNTYPATTPRQYTVRDNGLTIYDIQYVLDPNTGSDNSPYVGDTVTVTGIVTASSKVNDLGYVYIQQEGETEWAGIALVGSANLFTLFRTEEVEVTGVVQEQFGFTRLQVIDLNVTGNLGTITPVVIDPSDATLNTDRNMEKYESMLITLANPTATPMEIVDENLGFGEYSFGNTVSAAEATRVLAGRQDNNSFSSLYVSLITDTFYVNNQGEIEVDSIYVTEPGMKLDSLTGVMHYSFGNYKLFPRNNDDYVGLADVNGNALVIDSTPVALPDTSTGFVELGGEAIEMSVYPNPSNASFFVEFDKSVNANILITDLAGRAVFTGVTQGNRTRISTTSMPNGIYLMRLTSLNGEVLATEKLVIKH